MSLQQSEMKRKILDSIASYNSFTAYIKIKSTPKPNKDRLNVFVSFIKERKGDSTKTLKTFKKLLRNNKTNSTIYDNITSTVSRVGLAKHRLKE